MVMSLKKYLGGFVAASALLLAACGGGSGTTASDDATSDAAANEPIQVKVAVVGEINEPWDYVVEQLKEKENIEVELVKYTDYATPNKSLADGDVDLNAFQTEIFMDSFNEDTGSDLTTLGYTTMNPLGVYSLTYTDVADIPDGATVGIPNDPTNNGRALRLLQTAGLITVDPDKGLTPVIDDITDNPKNLNIQELDSSQTARALQDLDISIINSGMAVDAGYIPSEDAIFLEPINENSKPYYNVIASRAEDADSDVFKTIVEYYQSEGTAEIIKESTKGSSFPVWNE